jgi:hypothetical protein
MIKNMRGAFARAGSMGLGSIAVIGGVACATVVGPIVLSAATAGLLTSAVGSVFIGKKVADDTEKDL